MGIFNQAPGRLRAPTVCKTNKSPLVSDDEYLTFKVITNVAGTNLNPSGSATWHITYANPNFTSGTPFSFDIVPAANQSINSLNNDQQQSGGSFYLDPKLARWVRIRQGATFYGVYFLEPTDLIP